MALVLTVQQKWQIQMLMLIILLVKYHNSIRDRTYLLRAAVVHPSLSPWRYLYDHGDDCSFLHLTGLTREAFIVLQSILFPPEAPDEFGRRTPGGCVECWCVFFDPPYPQRHPHLVQRD